MAILTVVKNYQSVKEAKINISGLTVLRGESNAGKSSYLKALYAATHNRFRIGCIRYGEEFTEIKIGTSDSPYMMTVKRRETGSPRISLIHRKNPEDRQSWSKLNRDLPNEILEFLNFGFVNVSNSEKFDLNFFSQFQPPLLVGFSQKKIMDILSASKSVDDLNIVRKEIDIRRTKNSGAYENMSAVITETKANLAITEMHINDLKGLDKVEPLIQKFKSLEEKKQQLALLKERIDEYKVLKKQIKALETLQEFLERKEQLLQRKLRLQSLKSYVNQTQTLSKLTSAYSKLIDLAAIYKDLTDRSVKCLYLRTEIDYYFDLKKDVSKRSEVYNKYFELLSQRERITSALYKTSAFKKEYSNYFQIKSQIAEINKVLPVLEKIDNLKERKKEIALRKSELSNLRTNVQMIQSLEESVNSLKEIIDNNLCPYCGNKMDNHKH